VILLAESQSVLKKISLFLWHFIQLLIIIVGIALPIAFWIFYADLKSYILWPLLLGVSGGFLLGCYGVYHLIGVIKAKVKHLPDIPKQRLLLKCTPLIMALMVFGVYSFYYPTWSYDLGYTPSFGPYLALNANGGIQVSWDSQSPTETVVYYGLTRDSITTEIKGGEFYHNATAGEKSLHHCALITNLLANTTYYYKIGESDTIYSFRSPPAQNSLDKVVFSIQGDTQGNLNVLRQNIANLKSKTDNAANLDFMLIAGDLSNRDDRLSEWGMLMQSDSYGGLASSIPWVASSGNHETSQSEPQAPRTHFRRYFQNAFASNWIKETDAAFDCGLYYSFNYSNVHVVICDTLEYGGSSHNLSTSQLAWLDADLSRANAANMWTFVVFHSSMYSTSEHGPYPALANQMEPLMKSQRIDAIFWGHDHIFESYRAFTNETYGGTYCFMASGGGGSIKDVTNVDDMDTHVWNGTMNEYGNYINYANAQADHRFDDLRGNQWQLYAEAVHHIMVVEVNDQTATFTAYRASDGSLMASYTVQNH